MIKRHGLVLFLFCCSIIVGLIFAIPDATALFFFSTGALVLLITVSILFAAAVALWLKLGEKIHTRKPDRSILNQGTAFGVWFAGHNLSWALAGSLFTWVLLTLFGPVLWVMIFSAGALACTCFALTGIFIAGKRKMLGLCWQSPVPDGLPDFWSRAGAAVILRERYEYAAKHDQQKHMPVLWSISRVFDRAPTGGADRKVELMQAGSGFLSAKLKKEWLHRFKVLFVLFWVTAALAALPNLLGLTSHNWNQVPDGWPSAKMKDANKKKDPAPDKPQLMARKSGTDSKSSEENRSQPDSKDSNQNQGGDENKKTGQDQGNQSKAGSDTGQNGQESSDPGKGETNQEQESTESGKGSSSESSAETGHGDSTQGQEGKDCGTEGSAQGQKSTESGKESDKKEGGAEGSSRKAGDSKQGQQGKKGEGGGSGQKTGQPGQGGSGQGQKAKDSSGQGAGKSGQSDPGQGQKGRGEGSGGRSQEGGASNSGDAKSGQGSKAGESSSAGSGRGSGSPDHVPHTFSQPEPIPELPSRATDMVTIELPTLKTRSGKGESKKSSEQKPGKKGSPAPTTRFKTGEQGRIASKPEQYLPNWILMLMKEKKPQTYTDKHRQKGK